MFISALLLPNHLLDYVYNTEYIDIFNIHLIEYIYINSIGENCRLVVDKKVFLGDWCSTAFGRENRSPCYILLRPLLTQTFVLLEVNSPRNTTQGGAVVFMLNQLQAQPLKPSVDLI